MDFPSTISDLQSLHFYDLIPLVQKELVESDSTNEHNQKKHHKQLYIERPQKCKGSWFQTNRNIGSKGKKDAPNPPSADFSETNFFVQTLWVRTFLTLLFINKTFWCSFQSFTKCIALFPQNKPLLLKFGVGLHLIKEL